MNTLTLPVQAAPDPRVNIFLSIPLSVDATLGHLAQHYGSSRSRIIAQSATLPTTRWSRATPVLAPRMSVPGWGEERG